MKKILDHLLLSALFLVLIIIGASSLIFAGELPLTVLYTSNTLGEVEAGCCPEAGNNGGLARRAFYIKRVKKDVKDLLVLDGGDALAIGLPENGTEREKARTRAEVVLRIYEKMGYSALNIGDTDLVLGVEWLKGLQKNFELPFISANLKLKKSGEPVFRPFLIKEMNGFKVGIIGLLTPGIPPYLSRLLRDYFVDDPVKVALELVNGPVALCDRMIILAHLDPLEIESLAHRIFKTSIIVGGNNRAMEYPREIGQSLFAQTDAFGFHVGRLDLRLGKDSRNFIDLPSTNRFILLHPGMESDPEIESLLSQSKDRLKRPLP